MILCRLSVLNAVLILDIFNLTMHLLGCNPTVSQGATNCTSWYGPEFFSYIKFDQSTENLLYTVCMSRGFYRCSFWFIYLFFAPFRFLNHEVSIKKFIYLAQH